MKFSPKVRRELAKVSLLLGQDLNNIPSWDDLAPANAPIHWDWPGWLPRGFLTILASQAGMGKSSLCLRLAASYIDGRPWPDGTPFTATPGKILWVEGEDGHTANLERLHRWGLDPAQIVTPPGDPRQNFRLAARDALITLLVAATRDDVQFIVLDSLGSLATGRTSPLALRKLLSQLAGLARKLDKPFLLTHHLRKRTSFDYKNGQPNLDSLLGSSIISQIPRLIWTLDLPDPADPGTRRLSVIKNNLAPFPNPLGFHIDDHGLHFGPSPQPFPSQLEQAINFLTTHLVAGPPPATQILAAADAAALAPSTLRRAKKRLRIQSLKQSNQWLWHLPTK